MKVWKAIENQCRESPWSFDISDGSYDEKPLYLPHIDALYFPVESLPFDYDEVSHFTAGMIEALEGWHRFFAVSSLSSCARQILGHIIYVLLRSDISSQKIQLPLQNHPHSNGLLLHLEECFDYVFMLPDAIEELLCTQFTVEHLRYRRDHYGDMVDVEELEERMVSDLEEKYDDFSELYSMTQKAKDRLGFQAYAFLMSAGIYAVNPPYPEIKNIFEVSFNKWRQQIHHANGEDLDPTSRFKNALQCILDYPYVEAFSEIHHAYILSQYLEGYEDALNRHFMLSANPPIAEFPYEILAVIERTMTNEIRQFMSARPETFEDIRLKHHVRQHPHAYMLENNNTPLMLAQDTIGHHENGYLNEVVVESYIFLIYMESIRSQISPYGFNASYLSCPFQDCYRSCGCIYPLKRLFYGLSRRISSDEVNDESPVSQPPSCLDSIMTGTEQEEMVIPYVKELRGQ